MSRRFFAVRIDELEAAFDRQRDQVEFLEKLVDELSHRSTERARQLKARAVQALGTAKKAPRSKATAADDHRFSRQAPPASAPDTGSVDAGQKPFRRVAMPPISDAPKAILSAWTALEVLSPPSFRRPEDLSGGDRRAVAALGAGRLPWEGAGEKARPRTRLYYQIVLGTIDLEAAVAKLMAAYADDRAERHVARGEAVLAVVLVDRDGRPIDEPAVAVSSFGWAIPKALAGDLEVLGAWQTAEKSLVEGLDKFIRRSDAKDVLLPLDKDLILGAYNWISSKLGLTSDLIRAPSFAIRTFEYFKNPDPPESLLLNSFFLTDLATAADCFGRNSANDNLKRYLGVLRPPVRRDLLHDKEALSAAVRPALFPPARWPAPGRHPLVLLQQAAVNLALDGLREGGILAVNGPPGTGKTTLLRDIVAALVTERARAMLGFDDPEKAFMHAGQKLRAGNGWIHLYRLDGRLRGFEMLVASSNNKAVENISAEFPGLSAVADDAIDLRYFTTLSDALRERETWGLIAAVLGNAANRGRFKQVFWWDEDVGLSAYLATAAGTPRMVEIEDPETGEIETRPPRIVTDERAPRDHDDAMRRWRQARKAFRTALENSEAALRDLEAIRSRAESLPGLAADEARARDVLNAATADAGRAAARARDTETELADARRREDAATAECRRHGNARPGFFARLFRAARFRSWRHADRSKQAAARQAAEASGRAARTAVDAKAGLETALAAKTDAARMLNSAIERLGDATRAVNAARDRLGPRFVDETFFERDHADRHRLSPWLDDAAQRARDALFVAAMALHKAFVDAAAKPLRHNLGALMNVFGGRSLPGPEKAALLPDLWASFFLVVPVVSTTFASVERMLGRLPFESLGWLLVDEAGQALPQAAVGALMRTKRALVVGDPLQIEPVVVLPDTLTATICRSFGVDPDRFDAPTASVQTLADAATPYVAEFAGRQGSRTVGVPLLVHRRCADPMFGISNAVAYERLMVNAKAPARSAIIELLGPSRWFDVQGAAVDKWCPQEGQLVVALLQQIARANLGPDLYIVTPFVVVQDNLRKLIRDSGVPSAWTGDPWAWARERVGTVHVVQGREAEAVILVLGAPAPQQAGARGWAGGRPNLVNVAVSRAKEALYVVGNRGLWRDAGYFRELDRRMP
jgi:hypothetical protein